MTSKKPSVADAIKDLVRGTKATPVKTEPRKKSRTSKYYVKKGGNGGKRPNSGPDPLPQEDQRRTLKQAWRQYGLEEVEIRYPKQLEKGKVEERREKMSRLRVIQEAIYRAGASGNMVAAKEFNDRVLGKSPQPIVGDEDEAPVQIDLLGERILEKAYGDDDSEEE